MNLILSLIAIVLFTVSARAQVPAGWSRVEGTSEINIFIHNRAKSKPVITIRKIEISSDRQLEFLRKNLVKISDLRARLFTRLGLEGYTILDVTSAKQQGFKTLDVIHSRYRTVDGRDVQMIERQYVSGRIMHVVTYAEEANVIGDRKQVDAILDRFRPVPQPRLPAEVLAGNPSAGRPAQAGETSLEQVRSLHSPASDATCKDVPAAKRRKVGESAFADFNPLTMIGYCAKGIAIEIAEFVKMIGSLAAGITSYASEKEYFDQVNSVVGSVAGEFAKSPVAFTGKILVAGHAALMKYSDKFLSCYNSKAQAEATCRFLTYLIPVGLAKKVLFKSTATAAEAAGATRLAQVALQGEKVEPAKALAEAKAVEVIAETKTGELVVEAKAVEVKPPPPEKNPPPGMLLISHQPGLSVDRATEILQPHRVVLNEISGDQKNKIAALKEIASIRIDSATKEGSELIHRLHDQLHGWMSTHLEGFNSGRLSEELVRETMLAFRQFTRNHTGHYSEKHYGLSSRFLSDLEWILENYRLSDEVRKLAFDELKAMQRNDSRLRAPREFVRSVEMAKKDSVKWLDGLPRKFAESPHAIGEIDYIVPNASDAIKREVYRAWVEGGLNDSKVRSLFARHLKLETVADLKSLWSLGFETHHLEGATIVYKNSHSGGTVVFKKTRSEDPLKAADVNELRRVISEGGTMRSRDLMNESKALARASAQTILREGSPGKRNYDADPFVQKIREALREDKTGLVKVEGAGSVTIDAFRSQGKTLVIDVDELQSAVKSTQNLRQGSRLYQAHVVPKAGERSTHYDPTTAKTLYGVLHGAVDALKRPENKGVKEVLIVTWPESPHLSRMLNKRGFLSPETHMPLHESELTKNGSQKLYLRLSTQDLKKWTSQQ